MIRIDPPIAITSKCSKHLYPLTCTYKTQTQGATYRPKHSLNSYPYLYILLQITTFEIKLIAPINKKIRASYGSSLQDGWSSAGMRSVGDSILIKTDLKTSYFVYKGS